MTKSETMIAVAFSLLVAVAIYALFIYYEHNPEAAESASYNNTLYVNGRLVTRLTIDGCEYIQCEGGVTHKANCSNPVHREER